MQPTSPTRKPRASSQARIAAILDAARDLLADEGIGGLSIYSVPNARKCHHRRSTTSSPACRPCSRG